MLVKPIVVKEIRHILRDKRTLLILLILPIFLLIMFGYAINLDVKKIGVAILDEDKSDVSRDFINRFLHTEYFTFVCWLDSPDQIDGLILTEAAQVAIHLPPDFSRNLLERKRTAIGVTVDGSNPSVGQTASNYVEMIAADFAADAEYFTAGKRGEGRLPVEAVPRIWFNPDLLSVRFLVPGLISFILMVTAVVSTSLSIVREKERGSIEQLALSPVKSAELLVGKTIPYFFLALVNSALVLAASDAFFGVTVRGSYLVFFIVTFVFLIGCLGMGILISTLVRTQQNAFMVAVFLTVLPSYILSGFIFPIRNMPGVIQLFSYVVPNRYFLAALRSVMIRGVGIESFLQEFIFLLVFDAIVVTLAILRLRRIRRF